VVVFQTIIATSSLVFSVTGLVATALGGGNQPVNFDSGEAFSVDRHFVLCFGFPQGPRQTLDVILYPGQNTLFCLMILAGIILTHPHSCVHSC
jgi:hypothetical protein